MMDPVSSSPAEGGEGGTQGQRTKELSVQSLWFLGKSSETCFQEVSHPGIQKLCNADMSHALGTCIRLDVTLYEGLWKIDALP